MRYYRIEIGASPAGNAGAVYTSHDGETMDPGALQAEFHIPVTAFLTPTQVGNPYIRITGVTQQTVGQANDFNDAPIKVYGGMKKGLPLARPDQAGLLMQGKIQQAFGNWIGTTITLDLIVIPDGTVLASDPKNLVLIWEQGKPLSDAVNQALTTAFPDMNVTVQISDKLVGTETETSFYKTVSELADYLSETSKSIITDDSYLGVQIVSTGAGFLVYDGTVPPEGQAKDIAFEDLIGQPTWVENQVIQFTCVMRKDVAVGDFVKLPQTQVSLTPQSVSRYRDKSAFQGSFQVSSVLHVGSYKQPDAQSWVTVFNAYPNAPGAPAP